MAVGPAADEGERVLYFLYGYAPAEDGTYLLNDLQGQFGDIGEGGFSDGLSDAFGVSDEVAGRAVSVGDFGDVQGYYIEAIVTASRQGYAATNVT